MMKRIVLLVAMLAMMVAMAMPAFAAQGRGPEGGNPSCALATMQEQGRTVGENDLKPLPLGGQTSDVLPGNSEAGLEAAPQGVVFTSPGSPFSIVNPQAC